MFLIIGLLLQHPFLISGVLIGPDRLFNISERVELFLIKVSTWTRWLYVPATVAVLYDMTRNDVPWWVVALLAFVDAWLLVTYWNAARRALDEYEDVEDEEENADVRPA